MLRIYRSTRGLLLAMPYQRGLQPMPFPRGLQSQWSWATLAVAILLGGAGSQNRFFRGDHMIPNPLRAPSANGI